MKTWTSLTLRAMQSRGNTRTLHSLIGMQPGHEQSHQPPGEFNPFENLSTDLYRRELPNQSQQTQFRDGKSLLRARWSWLGMKPRRVVRSSACGRADVNLLAHLCILSLFADSGNAELMHLDVRPYWAHFSQTLPLLHECELYRMKLPGIQVKVCFHLKRSPFKYMLRGQQKVHGEVVECVPVCSTPAVKRGLCIGFESWAVQSPLATRSSFGSQRQWLQCETTLHFC